METRLKQLIDSRGLKQNWIAEQVGISEATLSRIIQGSTPRLDQACKLAELFEVPVEKLFETVNAET